MRTNVKSMCAFLTRVASGMALSSNRRLMIAGLVLGAACVGSTNAKASSIAAAQLTASGTAITLDQNPVVSAVLSVPGTFNGVATTRYIFLVDDGTGSQDVFATPVAGTLVGGYVPAVGDQLTISGPNSPFNGIPEMGTPTAITKISSGNSVPAPLVQTIPSMAGYTTQPTAGNPFPSFAGHLVTVENVAVSSLISGNYGTTNVSVTLTDGASNTLTGFYNPTTYSYPNSANLPNTQNLFGTPIARGPVNVTGVIQLFSGAPELLIMSITPAVPEPATCTLLGLCALVFVNTRKFSGRGRKE